MTVVPCPYCARLVPHAGDRQEGQQVYTPTPDGFERFLRVSVGLPADAPEVFPVNQTRGTRGDAPARRGRRQTGESITEEASGWPGVNHQ
jgi:hypothetical protein